MQTYISYAVFSSYISFISFPTSLHKVCTLCYVVSFLFVVLFKMVAQKITCPSRSDDIGNRYANSNTKRHGFFANESQDSKYFESDRNRSFKARKESAGERFNRSGYRRIFRSDTFFASGHHQLFRGKGGLQQPWVHTNIIFYYYCIKIITRKLSSRLLILILLTCDYQFSGVFENGAALRQHHVSRFGLRVLPRSGSVVLHSRQGRTSTDHW